MPLTEGQETSVQGSGKSPWKVRMKGGIVDCNCPSWRNCPGPLNLKKCKHTVQVMGGPPPYNGGAPGPASLVAQKTAPSAVARLAPAGGAVAVQDNESPDEVLAAVFGKSLPSVPQKTHVEHAAENHPAMGADPDAAYKQSILDRASAEGRQLRQDEKAKIYGPPVLLANHFEDHEGLDPTGWWCSEKYDGVRGWWDPAKMAEFISRQGNMFYAPAYFKHGLPSNLILDGELWMARKSFQATLSIVRTQTNNNPEWKKLKYIAFDLPSHGGPWEERYMALQDLVKKIGSPYLEVAPHDKIKSRQHAHSELKRYVAMGAEGIMLREPGSLYEKGRSWSLLKMKDFKDAEAVVIGYEAGKNKNKGKCGALVVKMPNGKQFNVGTGLTDADRRNPPKIGSVITYSYTELTDDGIPKCGAFVAVRDYE